MIRSRHHNITAVDKAIYLWTLCTIEWMHENNQPISNNNLDRLFTPQITKRFNFYREVAIDAKDLAPGGTAFTAKGQRVVNSWRKLGEKIYSVE